MRTKYVLTIYSISIDRKEKTMHKNIKSTARICLFILITLIFTALPISAFAAETDMAQTDTVQPDSAGDAESSEGVSLFDSILSAFEDNLSEILSALAFIGSLIIMLCYKRGLIPLVKEGLSALGAGVKKIGERTSELGAEASGITEQITERLSDAQKLLGTMEAALATLTARLDSLEDENSERRKLRAVLTAEVDMLYEIFSSAALPQYLKDSVGERIAKMRAELGQAHDDEN